MKLARKVYVSVLVWFDTEGNRKPFRIKFEDDPVHQDKVFNIDKVLDIRKAASLRVGGRGIRYTIRIDGKQSYLYEDENRWFIEAKDC